MHTIVALVVIARVKSDFYSLNLVKHLREEYLSNIKFNKI